VSARSDAVRTFEQAFELLFSRAAARHAYDELARGGAIAGQRGADQREIDVAAIGAARRLHRDEGRLR
jgi:hypothetical protein